LYHNYYISEWNALRLPIGGKREGQVKTYCPFCRESRRNKNDKSLSVNIETGFYTCHHCGKTGNIHKFSVVKEKQYKKPEWKNKTELSEKMVKWFEGRKITQEALKKLKVSEGLEWMPQENREVNTVQFNYFENGELVNVKYRDGKKNFKMFKDGKPTWYNIDNMGETVIIVEGEMDVLSFVSVGVDSVISVPNGASNFDFFDPDMFDNHHVIIAVDQDTAGSTLRRELIRRIGAERCSTVDFKDCKDANEYLIKYGANELVNITVNEVPVEGIVHLVDYWDDLYDLYKNGMPSGLKIRHQRLNDCITYETGRLMVVTGIPTHGKSEFVDEIAVQLNTMHGWRWGYFTPENFPMYLHASKLIAKLSGHWMQHSDENELRYYTEYVNENFFWVLPKDDEYTLETILDKAKYLVRKHGIKGFVIDPWNYIEQTSTLSETQFISKALGKLTNFARQYGVLMVLVAHPKKMEKSDGEFEVPNLYSISGSAHFFNKADYGITIYRSLSDEVQVHVQKVKFRHLGNKGMVQMANNPSSGRYQETVTGMITEWNNENYIINGNTTRI